MISPATLITTAERWPWTPAAALAAAVTILLAAITVRLRARRPPAPRHAKHPVPGARAAYLVALAATGVSLDTSWEYFGTKGLNITPAPVHVALFSVLELALLACGLMMRAGVHLTGRPGPARLVAWACCGASAYMAWTVSGPFGGSARVVLGPVLGLVMLHLALGIEVRARRGARTGVWARVVAELRERAISRLGLADEARPAAERTRERAANRAARLATPGTGVPWSRRRRLARALLSAGAQDPTVRVRLLEQLAVGRNAAALLTLELASPWPAANTAPDSSPDTNTDSTASANSTANSVANTASGVRPDIAGHPANTAEQVLTSSEQVSTEQPGQMPDSGGERPRLHALPGGAAHTQAELIRSLAEHGVTDPDEVVRRVREQFPDAKDDSVRTQLRRINRGAQPGRRAANQ